MSQTIEQLFTRITAATSHEELNVIETEISILRQAVDELTQEGYDQLQDLDGAQEMLEERYGEIQDAADGKKVVLVVKTETGLLPLVDHLGLQTDFTPRDYESAMQKYFVSFYKSGNKGAPYHTAYQDLATGQLTLIW